MSIDQVANSKLLIDQQNEHIYYQRRENHKRVLEGFNPREINDFGTAFLARSGECHKKGTEPLGSTLCITFNLGHEGQAAVLCVLC